LVGHKKLRGMTKETYFEEIGQTFEERFKNVPVEQLVDRLEKMPVVDVAAYLKSKPVD